MSNPISTNSNFSIDQQAALVAITWDKWKHQKATWEAEYNEVCNYVYATDTSTTSNKVLPWKNSTTIPKICQIFDNILANYIAALFPNSNWLDWEALDDDAIDYQKSRLIREYMRNKTEASNFREEIEKCLVDWLLSGNCFATVEYVEDIRDPQEIDFPDNTPRANYIGPRMRRIDPMNICFDLTATSFEQSPKIVRSLLSEGEMMHIASIDSTRTWYADAVKNKDYMRTWPSIPGYDDFLKYERFALDGFGSLQEYFQCDMVEILEFYGDFYDRKTKTLRKNRVITVANRCKVIRDEPWPEWNGYAPVYHCSWRVRPGNLMGMGPLANLVGMQYRLDHEENAKADAMDLSLSPVMVYKGRVDSYDQYGPMGEIWIDTDGDVAELGRNLNPILAAQSNMANTMELMELFAGAPKESMGFRTPGEKTAFEVQNLLQGGFRIFQQKATRFEINFLEKVLNGMFEVAKRTMSSAEVVRVFYDTEKAQIFQDISPKDIQVNGRIKPVGARHFAEKVTTFNNIQAVFGNQAIMQLTMKHIDSFNLVRFIENAFNLADSRIFVKDRQYFEQAEDAQLQQVIQQEAMVSAQMAQQAPSDNPSYNTPDISFGTTEEEILGDSTEQRMVSRPQ